MNRTITVKGVRSASVRPDYITISMTVESVRKDYNASMEDAAQRIKKLQDAVTCSGYQKEDLKTISIDVDTRYDTIHDGQGNYKRGFPAMLLYIASSCRSIWTANSLPR